MNTNTSNTQSRPARKGRALGLLAVAAIAAMALVPSAASAGTTKVQTTGQMDIIAQPLTGSPVMIQIQADGAGPICIQNRTMHLQTSTDNKSFQDMLVTPITGAFQTTLVAPNQLGFIYRFKIDPKKVTRGNGHPVSCSGFTSTAMRPR